MSKRFDRRRRLLVPERMDVEQVGEDDLAVCLHDLERLSRLTLGYRPTLDWIARVTAGLPRHAAPAVLDLGCGRGDMLRAIWQWSRRRGVALRLWGIDINPKMVALARAHTPAEAEIEYAVGDALLQSDVGRPDFVVCALFLHHLDDAQAVQLLRSMQRQAQIGWLVNDLHRHAVPYWFLRALPSALGMHRFVRHDGPVSVARGWTRAELLRIAAEAGVAVRLRWHMPFRWTLESASA
jgi:SAM-dependent methyltransferase